MSRLGKLEKIFVATVLAGLVVAGVGNTQEKDLVKYVGWGISGVGALGIVGYGIAEEKRIKEYNQERRNYREE